MVAAGDRYWFNLEFEPQNSLVRALHFGPCTLDDLKGFVDAVFTDSHWKTGMNVLSDFRQADPSDFSGDDMRQYVAYSKKYAGEAVGTKVATVVESPLNFGIVRIWDAEAEIQASPIENKLFDSLEAAEDWLGVPRK
jgi:hypothetical protein